MRLTDRARYAVEDADEVVAAATACPLCLRTAPAVEVVEGDNGGVALCHCLRCLNVSELLLTREQLLRLVLYPPPAMHVVLRSPT